MKSAVAHRGSPALIIILFVVALLVASSACSRDPNARKQKYFKSGQRYFQKGEYREAAIEFFNAIQIDQGYAEAHYQLAQSYLKVQQWSAAYQELARTVELQPENYQARIDMANLLIAGRSLPQAQEQTDLLLKQRPDDPQVHVAVSNLLAAQGKFEAAVGEMQKAITLAPSRAAFYVDLAMLQAKNNQGDAAETNLKKAIALDPKAADPPFLLATYYQSHNRFGEAEQQFRNAIAADPRNPELRGGLARLYLAEGKKAEAEQFLAQAKLDFPNDSLGYRMLGDFYFMTGDVDKATSEYTVIVRGHPQDLQARKNYVQLLILKKRVDEAGKLNDEILKTHPQDNDALVYRGEIQIEQGHLAEAVATLEMVTRNDEKNGLAHYHLGIALEKMGNLQRAETEWRDAARLRPDLEEAQRALAALAMRKGDMSALEQAATQIITLQPTSPDGYALRVISYINRKLFAEAENDVRRAIDVAPQSGVGYVQLGNLRFVQKQYNAAEKAYEDALARDTNSSDALRGLMNTFLIQNQIDRAIAVANEQIARSPNNAAFHELLGTALFHNKKDLKGAEIALRKSAELSRDNTDALIKLGEVQAASGQAHQAIATYQQAIKDHPREATFYTLIGELYERRQNWKEAQDAYQKALEIKPNDPLASNNLANVMLQTGGNVDVALSLAQTARLGMPDSPEVADTLGWIYYQKGAYQSAIGLLNEALKLAEKTKAPDNPDTHYHLGLAYKKIDQPDLARQHLERVLKIAPNYSDAAEVRKQLAQLRS